MATHIANGAVTNRNTNVMMHVEGNVSTHRHAAGTHHRCMVAAIAAICWAAAPLVRATAAALPHAEQKLGYVIVDQDLREALAGIGREIGVRVDVSEKVKGTVHGRLPIATVSQTLRDLASIFGFDWYYDGSTLAISSYGEADAKIIALGRVDPAALSHALVELGIADDRWPVRTASEGLIKVNGPPRYVAAVDQTLAALASRKTEDVSVHIFRGAASAVP